MERKHLINCNIAGFSYYEGPLVFKELEIGTELILKPEADNKYDPKAVAIYYKDRKLGYIPACNNHFISIMFEMGYDIFEAYIQKIDPTQNPENQIYIAVYVRGKANSLRRSKKK
jgi:hypothetical protein